jgi:phosphoribosyl-AMP cyclohydrolase
MTMPLSSEQLEYGAVLSLDFAKIQQVVCSGDILPVVVQHVDTRDVLILAYTNRDAFEKSLADKIAVFWSTSRKALWVKGATSGDYLDLIDVRVNCEQNSLLYLVRPRTGGVCHTRDASGNAHETCFYRQIDFAAQGLSRL